MELPATSDSPASTQPQFIESPQTQNDRRKRRIRSVLGFVLRIAIYLLITIVFVAPMFWVLGNSVRSSQSIWGHVYPVSVLTFLPLDQFSIKNYMEALGLTSVGKGLGLDLSRALFISFASAITVVCFSLVSNSCAAYFFARLEFPRKKILLAFVLATMMIPQQVVIVPLFLVVNQLGIINTFWALVVPWFASPFITFALIQFFSEVPKELDEAATLDGANLFKILVNVVIPNSIPGLLTVSLLEFQFVWNEFYWPLIAVTAKDLMPVQVAIASQFTERDPEWGRVFAAMVIASAPVIIIFMSLQRFYYQSAVTSGVKG
ncbi:MAG: carbohydrate ABC transporter permease [Thermomicrobiales bacterium]|nr:carbohydrate ABC transporter permease [Thermomicrobiales bacterium]